MDKHILLTALKGISGIEIKEIQYQNTWGNFRSIPFKYIKYIYLYLSIYLNIYNKQN